MSKIWRKLFPVRKVFIPYESSPSVSHVNNYEGFLVFTMNNGTIYILNNRNGEPMVQQLTILQNR